MNIKDYAMVSMLLRERSTCLRFLENCKKEGSKTVNLSLMIGDQSCGVLLQIPNVEDVSLIAKKQLEDTEKKLIDLGVRLEIEPRFTV